MIPRELEPASTGGRTAAEAPGARLTVYLPHQTAVRLDRESRRLHDATGGVSRSRLVCALVDVGFAHFGEVERAVGRRRDERGRARDSG